MTDRLPGCEAPPETPADILVPVPPGETETAAPAPREQAPAEAAADTPAEPPADAGRSGRRAATGRGKRKGSGKNADRGAGEKAGGGKKKKSLKRALMKLLLKLAFIAVLAWVLLTQVGGVFLCHTDDMFPALRDGDLVITFRLAPYRSGDVVAYRQDGRVCFGRVVGEPGDEIVIDASGNFTVNGLRRYEVIFYQTAVRESDRMTYPYTVQPGEYFLLADAREQGVDSRTFGPATHLLGKAVLQLRRRGF